LCQNVSTGALGDGARITLSVMAAETSLLAVYAVVIATAPPCAEAPVVHGASSVQLLVPDSKPSDHGGALHDVPADAVTVQLVPDASHEPQGPHETAQQEPSSQIPLVHSAFFPHACPFAVSAARTVPICADWP
jgi:hypothetical protein